MRSLCSAPHYMNSEARLTLESCKGNPLRETQVFASGDHCIAHGKKRLDIYGARQSRPDREF